MNFSHIVVGGGSSGTVMASRLSEDNANRVLLLEAGPDIPPGQEPATILDSYPGSAYLDPRFVWTDRRVTVAPRGNNAPGTAIALRRYEQGRVMGGSSAINGQMSNRGVPWDYDEWERRGATGWGWDRVLPFFNKLESDQDFSGPLHGNDGPLPIRRVPIEQWPLQARAFSGALTQMGLPWLDDQNGQFEDGHYPITISNIDDHRVSTAMAWLPSEVRARPNLTIHTDSQVDGLLFEGTRVRGVRIGQKEIAGQTVILCAGALFTPELLLRAGIGPAQDLRDLGIPILSDQQGVGRGLSDHPSVAIASYLPRRARLHGQRRHIMLGIRFSSDPERYPAGDMAGILSTKAAWHAVGQRLGTLAIWINRPLSEDGRITLSSADPRVAANVDFGLLSDPRDTARLRISFRRMAQVHYSPLLAGMISDPFPASYSEKVRQIGTINMRNALLTRIAALFLDGPAWIRRQFLERAVMEGESLATLMTDDAACDAFIRSAVAGVWHASCSCRMGAPNDPLAPLLPDGRVKGVEGLRVADASAFPAIPSANTNLPTIMLAEKLAQTIRDQS